MPAGKEIILCEVHEGSEAQHASNSMGYRGSLAGVKRPRSDTDHSPPPRAKVKNGWSYTSVSIQCLHNIYRANLMYHFWMQYLLAPSASDIARQRWGKTWLFRRNSIWGSDSGKYREWNWNSDSIAMGTMKMNSNCQQASADLSMQTVLSAKTRVHKILARLWFHRAQSLTNQQLFT
jgi:hypothetical protein